MIIETVGSGMVSSNSGSNAAKPVAKPASDSPAPQISSQGGTNITVTQRPVQSADANSGEEGRENPQGQNANQQASGQQIEQAVHNANNKLKMNHKTGCEFSYHEETGRVSIKVIDKETQEVIREVPPEESLDMLEKLWELAGILVDERC